MASGPVYRATEPDAATWVLGTFSKGTYLTNILFPCHGPFRGHGAGGASFRGRRPPRGGEQWCDCRLTASQMPRWPDAACL